MDMTRKSVITMIDKFEEQLHRDLHQFLQSMKEVDERLPENVITDKLEFAK